MLVWTRDADIYTLFEYRKMIGPVGNRENRFAYSSRPIASQAMLAAKRDGADSRPAE